MRQTEQLKVVYNASDRIEAQAVKPEDLGHGVDINKVSMEDLRYTVDIKGLKAILSCGAQTATKIGRLSKARIIINRRVFYYLPLVRKYLESIAI